MKVSIWGISIFLALAVLSRNAMGADLWQHPSHGQEKLAMANQTAGEASKHKVVAHLQDEVVSPTVPDAILEDCGDGVCDPCLDVACRGRYALFGEYLYLRPRSNEVAYAVPVDGPIVPPVVDPPVQIGSTALVDPDYSSGFRVGGRYITATGSSISASFTKFENDTSDQASITAPNVMFPLVIHPSTLNAAATNLEANARYSVDFDLIDLDYRGILLCGDRYEVGYLAGIRYGRLEQSLRAQYDFNGTTNVLTDVDFDGAGIRLGLDGERYCGCSGFALYGSGMASFLAGEAKARYSQNDAFAPTVADVDWRAGRIVSLLEVELGVAWHSPCDRVQVHAGYMMSAWFNAVKTEDFVKAVQANQLDDMSDTVSFDGLRFAVETRF